MVAPTLSGCIYMVVAVGAERFHAICHPLKYKPKPIFYLGFVVLISFLVNIPKFLEFKFSVTRSESFLKRGPGISTIKLILLLFNCCEIMARF